MTDETPTNVVNLAERRRPPALSRVPSEFECKLFEGNGDLAGKVIVTLDFQGERLGLITIQPDDEAGRAACQTAAEATMQAIRLVYNAST